MDTIGVSQTDFLSGEISMTFDLEKARDAAKFDDRMAITMFPLAIAEIERLRAEISEQKGMIWKTQQVKKEQAAQIKSLEDALVEERARGNHYGMSYEDAVGDGEFERWIIDGKKDLPKIYLDRVRVEAKRQLLADGKIGPDAAKPRSWQITDERKAAIDRGMRFLAWSNANTNDPETELDLVVLRAMLTEAGL